MALPVSPLFCECGCVILFEVCVVRAQIRSELRVEDVQADDEGERRSEGSDGESTVAGEDASGQSSDTDVEETGSKRLRVGDERFDFAFDRSLDRDPAVDKRSNGNASVGCEGGNSTASGTDLTFKFGLNGNNLDFWVCLRVDGELLDSTGKGIASTRRVEFGGRDKR